MGLLDILAERMNCTYLSDLRFLPRPNAALRQNVASIPLDDFPEYEWKDAAEYLCGVKCVNADSSRNTLLEYTQKRNSPLLFQSENRHLQKAQT